MTILILQQKWDRSSVTQKMNDLIKTLQVWLDRHHQRKQLASMDDGQLFDLGLTRKQVEVEIKKPFWK